MNPTAEHLNASAEILVTLLDLLGMKAKVQPEAEDEDVVLKVETDIPGRIIGRKGQNLESLELVLNRVLRNRDKESPAAVLDVDGYRRDRKSSRKRKGTDSGSEDRPRREQAAQPQPQSQVENAEPPKEDRERGRDRRDDDRRSDDRRSDDRRSDRGGDRDRGGGRGPRRRGDGGARRGGGDEMDESKLEQLAIDTAKEVKRWGDTKTLGPMSARERRVIHVTLEADPEVVSESGEERPDGRKTVVIRLA